MPIRTRTTGALPSTSLWSNAIIDCERTSTVPYTLTQYATWAGQKLKETGTSQFPNPYISLPMISQPYGKYSTISDSIDGKPTGFKLRDCSHFQVRWGCEKGKYSCSRSSTGSWGVIGQCHGDFTFTHTELSALRSIGDVSITTAHKNAVKSNFGAGQYQDANLGEFFMELATMKSLLTGVVSDLVRAVTSKQLVLRTVKGYGLSDRKRLELAVPKGVVLENKLGSIPTLGSAWKQFGSASNSLYLSYIFGVAPALQDMRKMSSTLTRLNQHMSRIDRAKGETVAYHASKSEKFKTTTTGNPVQNLGYDFSTLSLVREAVARYTVSAYYRYPAMFGKDSVGKLRQLILAHGFSTPLTTAWNSIPLSFLLDYVLPLGDWLSGVRINDHGIQFLGACESSLIEMQATGKKTVYPVTAGNSITGLNALGNPLGESATAWAQVRSYSRSTLDNPTSTSFPGLTLPDWRQYATSASLLYSLASRRGK